MSNHTDIYTYFTKANGETELIYSAEEWMRIELQLETAGPVAVSTRQEVTPVLSGKGILLPPTGEPIKFLLPRGDRLYIGSEAVNRVKFIVEPVPLLEQILQQLKMGFGSVRGLLGVVRRKSPGPAPTPAHMPPPPQPQIPQVPKRPMPRIPRIPNLRR
jgi:hypothetical protein